MATYKLTNVFCSGIKDSIEIEMDSSDAQEIVTRILDEFWRLSDKQKKLNISISGELIKEED